MMEGDRSPEQRRSDAADEYERMHPSSGSCKKHGHWAGAMDECPQCMNEDDIASRDDVPGSLCWGCEHCQDEPGSMVDCSHYGFPQRPRKKKCKHFADRLPDVFDDNAYPDYEDGMEGWEP